MAIATRGVIEACESAKRASRALAAADTASKDGALRRLAELLGERADEVLEANAADLADERAAGLNDALRDRLTLTRARIDEMADGVRAIDGARRSGRRGDRAADDSRTGSTCARCGCRWASSR